MFKCQLCGEQIGRRDNLRRHYLAVHGASQKELDDYMPERKQSGLPPKEKATKVPFSEAIQGILGKIKESPVCKSLPSIQVPVIKGEGDEEEVVVVLSDWQIGHKTRSFDSTVAKKRVEALLKAITKIVEIHRRAYPIKKLRVLLAGDFVQSEKVGYLVDLSELECILLDQIFGYAVPLLSWFLAECAKNFEEINVHCVRGNHGRGERGSSEKTNWDDVIYKSLEFKFADIKHIKFHIAREFFQIFKVANTRFLLAHGDQVRGGSYGIPLYALLQRMLRWATSMTEDWDVLVVGHWHCYGHIEQNEQELIVNGTLVSDDEYVRRQYGWSSSTLQVMFGVHPRKGITWEYRLKL